MTRESILILVGLLVILTPFAGLPLSWLSWILPVLGLLVVGIALWQRRDRMPAREPDTTFVPVKNPEIV